jgi:hypothetical protein
MKKHKEKIPPKKYLEYCTLQRQNTDISKQIFPEKEYRGLSPNFHIHASVSDLRIRIRISIFIYPFEPYIQG